MRSCPSEARERSQVRWRRLLYGVAFAVVAAAAALAVSGRVVEPQIPGPLLLAAGLGLVAGLPGLFHGRLTLLSVILLPVGAYLLARWVSPLPKFVHGFGGQMEYYLTELRFGLSIFKDEQFPLTLAGPGLELLVLMTLYGLVGLASTVGLGARRPLLGLGILLGLLGYTFTVDEQKGNLWMALGLIFLAVVVLLVSQALHRGRWGVRDAAAGFALGGAALLVAGLVLGVAPSLAARGWEDWHNWDPFVRARGEGFVFNWKQNYPRMLDPSKDFPVMKVTSAVPSYWKANTLDTFTGDSWLSIGLGQDALEAQPDFRTVPNGYPTPPGSMVRERFEIQSMYITYLFVGGIADRLKLLEPVKVFASDGGSLRLEKTLGPELRYEVQAVIPRLNPTQLVGLGRDYPKGAEAYLDLPFPSLERVRAAKAAGEDWQKMVEDSNPRGSEFAGMYDLSQQIVGDATDPYEIVLLVEQYLRTQYHYSLTPRPSALHSPYAAFLFDSREGYCQHFSGAMALLLRLNGIPARVAVGFVTGKPTGTDGYAVSSNNAHAWVEVLFPGIGWLPFDPTPGNGLPVASGSSSTAGFADPFEHDRTTTATAVTLPPDGFNGRLPEDAGKALGLPGAGGTGAVTGTGLGAMIAGAGILALLAAYPFVRRRLRERGLRAGSREGRLRAVLGLIRADLRDFGLEVPVSLTWDEVAELIEDETGLDARPVAESGQRVIFGGREAVPEVLLQAGAFRDRLRRRLGSTHGWSGTVMAWYGVAGLARWRVFHRRVKTPLWWRAGARSSAIG
jgi:protein-glutamine gamma-glutamyltransferase